MDRSGVLDLYADRWTPFFDVFAFVEQDLTGASFSMQIRAKPNATGPALVDLATITTSGQGLRQFRVSTDDVETLIAGGRLGEVPPGYELTDVITVSELSVTINETTMETLAFTGERDEDSVLYWDLHVTPSGGRKYKAFGGKFVVVAGVTQ